MKILVECTCQVPYEFEIEPVDGKMPGPVYCPTCGVEGTAYADEFIEQELRQAQADHKHRIALKRGLQSDEPVESVPGPAVAQETPTEEPSGLPRFCYIHTGKPMEGFCFTCKKPICLECMRHFGYFCSPYCRGRAEDQGMDIPEYEGRERVMRVKEYTTAKLLVLGVVLALVALVGVYEWWTIIGQKPRVKFSMRTTEGGGLAHAQFVGDAELLLLSADKLQVYDYKKKQLVWSASLAAYHPGPLPGGASGLLADKRAVANAVQQMKKATPEQIAAAQQQIQNLTPAQLAAQGVPADAAEQIQKLTPEEIAEGMAAVEDYYQSAPEVRVEGNNIWLTLGRHIVCFDRATGAEKAKAEVQGRIRETAFGDNALVVVSSVGTFNRVFTRVELPSGTQQTETGTLPPPPKRPVRKFSGDMDWPDPDAIREEEPWVPDEQHAFHAAGPTVAQLDVKLLEKKFVTVETMKKTSAQQQKKFDEDLKVTDTREYAADVMGEMARMKGAGSRKVNESRYTVTIGRVFSKDAAPWTGEVVGPPSFFALKTVDVLVAGKMMYVFNRNNQKIWETTLPYPIASQYEWHASEFGDSDGAALGPCMEVADTLFFYDQAMLRAYETKSGKVRWALPSVGIFRIQLDDRGMLYLSTTSASPESIQYSEQIDFTNKVEPIIVKIDPATGTILWSIEKTGDQCYPTGKYLYAAKSQTSGIDVMSAAARGVGGGGDIPTHFRLLRLNPKNGKEMWDYYRPDMPGGMDFHGNQILFQYHDKLEVLSFLSL